MATQQAYCYYPNGDAVADNNPCVLDQDASPCCGNGWTCLENGLCYNPISKALARGTCTDPSWTSPQCPQFCTKSLYSINKSLDHRFFDFLFLAVELIATANPILARRRIQRSRWTRFWSKRHDSMELFK